MGNISAYFILIAAVVLGTASNGFAKSSQGFTILVPSIFTALTIVGCMYALSLVMKNIPVGITYASFAGLCIIATVTIGVLKFNQIPNLYVLIGLGFIILGVFRANPKFLINIELNIHRSKNSIIIYNILDYLKLKNQISL